MKGKPIKLPRNTPPGATLCKHALLLWQCAMCSRADQAARDKTADGAA